MIYLDKAVTKSLDEFMEYYKVVDTEEIYSNGTEFVPIFRVKQWEEYNNKDKEIERLNNIINELQKEIDRLEEQLQQKENIIKEVREYIEKNKHLNWYNDSCYMNDLLEILDDEKV